MTEQITLNIEGRKVKVDKGFLDLSPEEQNETVEEITGSLGVEPANSGFMAQLNQGIAEGTGGLLDLLNPFDTPAVANVFGSDFSTGSAKTGIENLMDATGIKRAEGEPEGFWPNVSRGAGQAQPAPRFPGAAGRSPAGT